MIDYRVSVGVVLAVGVGLGAVISGQTEEFSTGVVEANGLTFHYLEAGEGPTVLALHGFPDHARSYRHQLTALSEAGYSRLLKNSAKWDRQIDPVVLRCSQH